ncbi:hypothetical protein [Mycobacteroides abscessus]|uniref:hypothetical protein n=1 Tax=Mycobacteroides abscessus TaxID=36809 RepID=UPI00104241E5|nr:hypothetical protein [Mycobacteroides abscessus]
MATARRAPSVTAFDEYLYLRVADIPVHLLPFAYDSSGSRLPVRDECAHYWFGIFGPEDHHANVGVRGAGDHCASCSDNANDAGYRAKALSRLSSGQSWLGRRQPM